MEWMKERPKKEGYYWLVYGPGIIQLIVIYSWPYAPEDFYYKVLSKEETRSWRVAGLSKEIWFMGPLEVPGPPEGRVVEGVEAIHEIVGKDKEQMKKMPMDFSQVRDPGNLEMAAAAPIPEDVHAPSPQLEGAEWTESQKE